MKGKERRRIGRRRGISRRKEERRKERKEKELRIPMTIRNYERELRISRPVI